MMKSKRVTGKNGSKDWSIRAVKKKKIAVKTLEKLNRVLMRRYAWLENELIKLYRRFDDCYAHDRDCLLLSHSIVAVQGRIDEVWNMLLYLTEEENRILEK